MNPFDFIVLKFRQATCKHEWRRKGPMTLTPWFMDGWYRCTKCKKQKNYHIKF